MSSSSCSGPSYAAIPRAHHVVAQAAAAFFSDQGHGQLRRQDGANFNLQFGGPFPRASPEFPPLRCQVVRPRWCSGGRRWMLSAGGGMQGPDCVCSAPSRVLGPKCQDVLVILLFFLFLACKLSPLLLF